MYSVEASDTYVYVNVVFIGVINITLSKSTPKPIYWSLPALSLAGAGKIIFLYSSYTHT